MRKVSLTILCMLFVLSIAGFAMAQAQGQDQGSRAAPDQNQSQDMENMDQGQDQAQDQDSQAADQEQYRSHHMMPRWWERPKTVQKLKLTNEEQTRIRAIYDKNSQDLDKMRTDLRNQGKQLRDMLAQDKLDDNAIAKQIDTLSATLANLVKAELQMNAAMMNELTADQRKQLVQMHEQWMERMKHRRGPRTGAAGAQTE